MRLSFGPFASLGTVDDILPVPFPFLPPSELPTARGATLLRKIGLRLPADHSDIPSQLLMVTNQKPLAAATRGSIRLRMSPVSRSDGGFSCANINRLRDRHRSKATRHGRPLRTGAHSIPPKAIPLAADGRQSDTRWFSCESQEVASSIVSKLRMPAAWPITGLCSLTGNEGFESSEGATARRGWYTVSSRKRWNRHDRTNAKASR